MIPFDSCCIYARRSAGILKVSTPAIIGHRARLIWVIIAVTIGSYLSNPGLIADASGLPVSTALVKAVPPWSICKIASGTNICMIL